MKKKGGHGGLHPTDCTCGKEGCWSNNDWVRRRVARAIKEGKPLPANFPERIRNLVILDASGAEVASSKDGQVPSVTEQVEGAIKRKLLPMPSEVRQQTIITEQVPLAVDLPWGMIAETINGQLPPEAPVTARIDSSKEKERILNEDFHAAFPDVMVGPKVKFALDVVLWTLPAWLFWLPRWLKGKFKNFRWPWSKKAPEDAKIVEPKPAEVPVEVPKV